MTRHVYDESGTTLIRIGEAEPVCGEDFCDKCGDCLDCYGSDPCPCGSTTAHLWVQYGEREPT